MAKGRSLRPVGIGWVVTWWLLPAFALMVFMTAQEMHQPREEPAQIEGGPDWEQKLHARIEAVTAALQHSSLGVHEPVETTTGSGSVRYVHRSYNVTFRPERQIETELAIEALREVDPGVTITRAPLDPEGFEIKIGVDGLLTHTIRFQPLQPPAGPPRVAVVVRGLGDDLRVARELVGIDAPIALGIEPSRPFSKEVAELARIFGREVLLDLSVMAAGDAGTEEPGIVLVDGQLRSQLDHAMASVPYAVGVTAEVNDDVSGVPERLDSFAGELNRRGLFWVGNLSSPQRLTALGSAVGLRVVMTAMSANNGKQEGLEKRLDEIGERARTDAGAVAVVAAGSEALKVLAAVVPKWRASGIDVVPVSSLPRAVSAAVAH
jgi:polysaccharide deacetylase 2 family uncharacterized protein YibQ